MLTLFTDVNNRLKIRQVYVMKGLQLKVKLNKQKAKEYKRGTEWWKDINPSSGFDLARSSLI